MDERKRSSFLKKIFWRTTVLFMQMFLLVFAVIAFFALVIYGQIPSDDQIRGCLTTKMFQVELCPGSKNYVRLSQISQSLRKAVLTTEDSAFYEHSGFDFQELQNSFQENLEKGKFARGGSTITQQLAKNMFLNREKTIQRKLFEALITMRLERVLSKNEILERYFNVVQFGKNIFGVKQAAQFYFKKHPSELSINESAFLAMLLPNPEVYAKSFYLKQQTPFAKKRLNQIVERMHSFKKINDEDYLLAKEELTYFLSGKPPETIDESLDLLNEEDAPLEEDL
jgi:monofunctional biosynthetic peptidoglycan transglycosylase